MSGVGIFRRLNNKSESLDFYEFKKLTRFRRSLAIYLADLTHSATVKADFRRIPTIFTGIAKEYTRQLS